MCCYNLREAPSMEEWELRWQIMNNFLLLLLYSIPTEMFSMHTAHLANVSKSVTKNATFSRTGGLPCLITHSCMSAASPTVVGGLIFCISATPQLGSLFPLFHGLRPSCKSVAEADVGLVSGNRAWNLCPGCHTTNNCM